MLFQFGQYKVDVDVEKTKHFYENAETVSEGCSCAECRNFEQAVTILPKSVTGFFDKLGVDMRKVCECYANCTNEDGTLFYGGFFHVSGTMLGGESAWKEENEEISYWHEDETFQVSENFHVSFQEGVFLLEKDFQLPVIQVEFSANIPWVLDEEK